MCEAIEQVREREEKREALRSKPLDPWDEFQKTGLHVSAVEIDNGFRRGAPMTSELHCMPQIIISPAAIRDPERLGGLCLEATFPKLAGSHASELLRDDEPRPLENPDMLLHASQRHLELVRETGDRRVSSPKLIDDPPAGRI